MSRMAMAVLQLGWGGLTRPLRAAFGDANKNRTEEPLVIGVTGQNDLSDGPGWPFAALDLEHRLVTVGIKRLPERRLDPSDAMSHEGILQSSFARSHPGQQIPCCLVLGREVRWHALQRARQVICLLQQLLDQLRRRKPDRILALSFDPASKVFLVREHAHQAVSEFSRFGFWTFGTFQR